LGVQGHPSIQSEFQDSQDYYRETLSLKTKQKMPKGLVKHTSGQERGSAKAFPETDHRVLA
ncbi:hypothetical protein ACQP3L_32500, partial [Escherichia coli]